MVIVPWVIRLAFDVSKVNEESPKEIVIHWKWTETSTKDKRNKELKKETLETLKHYEGVLWFQKLYSSHPYVKYRIVEAKWPTTERFNFDSFQYNAPWRFFYFFPSNTKHGSARNLVEPRTK